MLREKLSKYNVILASGSPRRQQFLKDLDIDFSIDVREVDEVYPRNLRGVEITDYLAKLKAEAFRSETENNDLIITSDTIVWHKKKALGKPKDENDAIAMLESLSNSTHQVYTSVCIKYNTKYFMISDVTEVTFSELSNEMITYYVDNFKPLDKAGSYGIQDWIGNVAITKIEGSYTNVMGLPTEKLFSFLNRL